MGDSDGLIQRFVLDFLSEIGAEASESGGVWHVVFPQGRRRRFGRERRFTFDPERRREHVELIEAGSPFLRMLQTEAQQWGGLATCATGSHPSGTRLYTFRIESYSSARKRIHFAWALLPPGTQEAVVREGVPSLFDEKVSGPPARAAERELLEDGVEHVLEAVERLGRQLAQESVRESHEAFHKAMGRVHDYAQGMKQDTFLEEARIKKRLGEIQSKLYFTEDGLREIKLQREAERLTKELHGLKKRNTEAQESILAERSKQEDQLRRRYEPRLRVVLVSATLIVGPSQDSGSTATIPQ